MYGDEFNRNVSSRQLGILTPTLDLEGLADLLQALQTELEAAGDLISLWSHELKFELNERFRQ